MGRLSKEGVDVRNWLENVCYQVKNMAGEQLGNKMSAGGKAAIEKSSKDSLEWFDARQDASKSEVEEKTRSARTQPADCCEGVPAGWCRWRDAGRHAWRDARWLPWWCERVPWCCAAGRVL